MIEIEDMHGISLIFAREGQYVLNDGTITFSVRDEQEKEMRRIIIEVYDAVKEKGDDTINQIVGYILSEDPTYITNYKNARSLICKIDRDELLYSLVKSYLSE